MNFAEKIRELREKVFGDSRQAFATRCGMSVEWVRSIETGRIAKPAPPRLAVLAERLGVRYEEMQSWPAAEVEQESRRVTLPADVWAELDQGRGLQTSDPKEEESVQEYAIRLLRDALGLPQRETGTASQRTAPTSPSHVAETPDAGTPVAAGGQTRKAPKRHSS